MAARVMQLSDFVNAANVALGIYCSAANIPFDAALKGIVEYSRGGSEYGNVKMHWLFDLPERSVLNLKLGYYLQEHDLIPGPAE